MDMEQPNASETLAGFDLFFHVWNPRFNNLDRKCPGRNLELPYSGTVLNVNDGDSVCRA